jgi:hypothetical protein
MFADTRTLWEHRLPKYQNDIGCFPHSHPTILTIPYTKPDGTPAMIGLEGYLDLQQLKENMLWFHFDISKHTDHLLTRIQRIEKLARPSSINILPRLD